MFCYLQYQIALHRNNPKIWRNFSRWGVYSKRENYIDTYPDCINRHFADIPVPLIGDNALLEFERCMHRNVKNLMEFQLADAR